MTSKRVTLLDVCRGSIKSVPDLGAITRGLVGLAKTKPNKKQSIGLLIEEWAQKTPHATALQFEDKQWTYAEFNGWANRIAAVLAARGVKSGDAVAILMENRPEALVCVAAAVKLGAIAGLLNHNQRGDVLAHSLSLVEPKAMIVSAESQEAVESLPEGTQITNGLWLGGDNNVPAPAGWEELAELSKGASADNPASTQEVVASSPCFYIFTSGTTGLPKASVMSHFRWLSSCRGMGGAAMRLRGKDIFYCCLPLYHNNALTVAWGAVLAGGASLALDRKFSASRFWDRIRHYEATGFVYIGELLRYLLNQPESAGDRDHKIKVITGNGLRPEIWADFEERFNIPRINEFYSASEINIAFINAFGVSQTAGFTPLSFDIVEFDNEEEEPVRGEDGLMRRVGKNGVGLLISEITEKRPFDGYTDEAATEKKILRDVFKRGDMWFNSGDLVRRQGYRHIQFVDRVGDTFRWKGENVATGEVEGAFAKLDSIEQAVVYGVEVPNTDGRAGMAAISIQEGHELDGKALAASLHELLPAYAVPLFLRIREQQETTGTFKYRKVELKKEAFDPEQVSEPLLVLLEVSRGYEPLTAELLEAVRAGKLRL